jgi:hypothetical protein
MAVFTCLVKGIIGALGVNVDLEAEPTVNPEDCGWHKLPVPRPRDGLSSQLDADGGYAYELVPLNPSCFRLSRRSMATFAS